MIAFKCEKIYFNNFFSFFIFKDVNAKNGNGDLKLSTKTMEWFIQYLYGSNDTYGDGKK